MTKEEYRAAFSKLQPSREAVDRLLAIPEEQPKRRRPIRLGALIAVAAIVVLLLAGTVYAVTNWFRLSDASQIEDPNQSDTGTPNQPAPQHAIELEDSNEGNYIGFTLDGWALPDRKQGINDIMLKGLVESRNPGAQPSLDPATLKKAYTQYYPILPDGELLCIQILDRDGLGYRDYFTRYETELIKEGNLKGLEVVWLTIKGRPNDYSLPEDSYHLFCHSEALHCTLVVSSNRSFERCEEALSHLTLVDSGVPLKLEALTVCGVRLNCLPDGFEIDQELTELMDNSWSGWKRKDPNADLSDVYGYLALLRPADGLRIVIGADAHHLNYDHVGGYSFKRAGTLNGHETLWYDGSSTGTALLYRCCDQYQIHLLTHSWGPEIEAILETLAVRVEAVPVEIVRQTPLEFRGFSQG